VVTVARVIKGLVDHLGRPIHAAVLREEISGPTLRGVRQILGGHPEIGLTPQRLAGILRRAENHDPEAYLELAEAMEEKDLHYLSVLGTRKRAVAQLPITVEAADETPQAEADAELVRTWLKRDCLEDELFDVLDAIGKGFSVSEIVWETTARAWMPARLIWRDPRWFQFDAVGGERLSLRDGTADGAELEPFKYLVHLHKAKSGLPVRGGLARSVAWGYLFKNYALKDWVAFAEIYGLPFRVGRYDVNASDTDRRDLLRAVSQMGADAAGIIPKSTEIEFIDGKSSGADGALFSTLAEYLDRQISKAVLGQTATTDAEAGGLGGSQGTVHNDVRGDIERADAKLLAATLNQQLVRPLVQLNHGPREAYPRLIIGREESVDLDATTSALDVLVRLGVKVPVSWARNLIRAPEPKDGEDVLGAPAPADPAPPLAPPAPQPEKTPQEGEAGDPDADVRARASRGAGGPLRPFSGASKEGVVLNSEIGREPDELEALAAEALDGWEPVIAPIVDPVRRAAETAVDLEDLRGRLAGLIAEIDLAAAAQGLARATFMARLAGETAVPVAGVDPDGEG
jgi:phage gp29-like protein